MPIQDVRISLVGRIWPLLAENPIDQRLYLMSGGQSSPGIENMAFALLAVSIGLM